MAHRLFKYSGFHQSPRINQVITKGNPLRRGDWHHAVRTLRGCLRGLKYIPREQQPTAPDFFDDTLAAAFRTYQGHQRIAATGEADFRTLFALDTDMFRLVAQTRAWGMARNPKSEVQSHKSFDHSRTLPANAPAGTIVWHDNHDFDLFMVEEKTRYRLIVRVSILFSFEDSDGEVWESEQAKADWLNKWVQIVKDTWKDPNLYRPANGKPVQFEVEIDHKITAIPGFDRRLDWEWNATVEAYTGPATTRQHRSNVVGMGPSKKRRLNFHRGDIQFRDRAKVGAFTAAHEFGHILGLRDEYPEKGRPFSAHVLDMASIMNGGMAIRRRHLEIYRSWVAKRLEGL